MNKQSMMLEAVHQISSYIQRGFEITVNSSDQVKFVSVRNPRNGDIEELAFKVPWIGVAMFDHETTKYLDKHGYKQTAPSLPAKPVKAIGDRKKNAKWWSRFNFEKNIMRMTLLALQDRYPAEQSFPQTAFAQQLASMMSWELSTARNHITRAAKMGILNRAIIGTAYHVTGLNDVDADTARQAAAERQQPPAFKPLPGDLFPQEETPAPSTALAHEGRIQFEQEVEQAIDETLLP